MLLLVSASPGGAKFEIVGPSVSRDESSLTIQHGSIEIAFVREGMLAKKALNRVLAIWYLFERLVPEQLLISYAFYQFSKKLDG
mmetsp:Transcript_45327/g.88596  ORF Transcript_45327/g.88596 Transcript_45327/m.88596 type:complete len:84 (-) Transcript_45327:117-368(-)